MGLDNLNCLKYPSEIAPNRLNQSNTQIFFVKLNAGGDEADDKQNEGIGELENECTHLLG